MKKIAIIGCSGSGKSMMSLTLSEQLNIPVYHLDRLNWQPNWEATPRDEFDEIQKKLVKKDQWIIDGNYNRTLDIRLKASDTIILLDMPRRICLYRVVKRFFKYRKKSRPDMNEDCHEKLDLGFLKWVWQYNKNNRSDVLKKLKENELKEIIILKSPKQVSRFLKMI